MRARHLNPPSPNNQRGAATSGVGIYKRKILRKKERKHDFFDQEKSKVQEKKGKRKHDLAQEKKSDQDLDQEKKRESFMVLLFFS